MDAPGNKRETPQEDIRGCQQREWDECDYKTALGNVPQIWAVGSDGGQD